MKVETDFEDSRDILFEDSLSKGLLVSKCSSSKSVEISFCKGAPIEYVHIGGGGGRGKAYEGGEVA